MWKCWSKIMHITLPPQTADNVAASTEHAILTYDGPGNEDYQFALPDLQRVTDGQELCYNLPLRADERAELVLQNLKSPTIFINLKPFIFSPPGHQNYGLSSPSSSKQDLNQALARSCFQQSCPLSQGSLVIRQRLSLRHTVPLFLNTYNPWSSFNAQR